MPRALPAVFAAALSLLAPPGARALGGTELEHVARRIAEELGTEARPAEFGASDGSEAYELGPDGIDGLLLLSGVGMGHAFEPAEVPGQGGELLRIPQLVVGVRHLLPGREPLCGAAVLELQLDPKTRVPHASGLRLLSWANLDELPESCGVLARFRHGEDGLDGLVFEIPMRDRRENAEEPPAYRSRVVARLVPGGFARIGAAEREPLDALPSGLPWLVECRGVDDCVLVAPEEDESVGLELVAEIAARLPEVRVVERDAGWGWTKIQLEGPRRKVDKFLVALQEDERTGSMSTELLVRSGELAKATIRFQAADSGG